MKIAAEFVISAADARDLPQDGLPRVALVGRSNVGKSSLINALVRQRIARISAAPGKTRLANIYRVGRGAAMPLYLVDLPGYGYARGDAGEFRAIAAAAASASDAALLVIDARHPGLGSDVDAWTWLKDAVAAPAIVATKMDKLSRAERLRAIRTIEAVFDHPVAAVSADTGEGLEELWKLIDRLANSSNRPRRPSPPPPNPMAAAARPGRPPRPRRPRNSSSRR